MSAIGDRLAETGYLLTQPHQVLDASLYGAPQKRKRLILLGHRQDLPPLEYPQILNRDGLKKDIQKNNNQTINFKSVKSTIGDLSKVPVFRGNDLRS